MAVFKPLLLPCLLWILVGCESLGYLTQAAGGQLRLLSARQPVDRLIANAQTPAELKAQLSLAKEILLFAETDLGLKQGKSYHHYVALPDRYVLWNVFVAEAYSVSPVQSCFPIAGCVPYRGYFRKEKALAYAAKKERAGLDTFVSGVAGYSTLGWLPDPLLSSFFRRSDAALAGLLFHELAHRLIYLPGDSQLNESFATVVEQRGVCLWLKSQQRKEEFARWYQEYLLRLRFSRFINKWKERLDAGYGSTQDEAVLASEKRRLFAEMKADYRLQSWPDKRYDVLIDQLNNASLGAFLTYFEQVEPLYQLLTQQNYSLPKFYDSFKALTQLKPEARRVRLKELAASVNNQDEANQSDDCRPD